MTETTGSIPSNPEARKEVETPLLDRIGSPADLRRLPVEQLPAVCRELRECIISNLSSNPGHFASSMGAVEMIVALHYVFDTPTDRLVWDVGHQAYAHKLLTGRRAAFATQRTHGGISGFPTPLESEYDTFTAGHASNSISAALGMAIADANTPGRADRKTVAVIGDASISGGLAFEGLNNVSNNPNNLLIVLNDNDMSIDNNVGALHRYLSEITTSASYNRLRQRLYSFFRSKGLINDDRKGRLIRFNNSLKAFIAQQQNIFEGLNIRYFGPIDGHDVVKLVKVLREIKDMKGPRLLHLRTVKGKGFPSAEKDPTTWHAPGKFDPETGERMKKSGGAPLWQDVFGETLVELAGTHPEVMAITAGMPTGTSVSRMMAAYPDRTFDVGISEGHAVTFAGGLAAAGKRPFVGIYSSFLQRAYDNLIHDVAIQGLPVTFCIDRAGIVGEDGVTHHGLFDLACLRCVPGLRIASPSDEATLRSLMLTSIIEGKPMAIRYPRGKAFTADWRTRMTRLTVGKGRKLSEREGARIAVLTLGPIAHDVERVGEELMSEGIAVDHYDMIWLKPLDDGLLSEVATNHDAIVTVEDASATGGLGSAVAEWMQAHSVLKPIEIIGVPDRWVSHGSVEELRHDCGYASADIAERIRRISDTLKKNIGHTK